MTTTGFADWQVQAAQAAAERERLEAQLAEVAPLCGTMDGERTTPLVVESCERLLAIRMAGRSRDSRPNERLAVPVVLTFMSTNSSELLGRHPAVRQFVFPAGSTITRLADNHGRSLLVRSRDPKMWVQFDPRPGGQYVLVKAHGFEPVTGRSARPHGGLGHGPDRSE